MERDEALSAVLHEDLQERRAEAAEQALREARVILGAEAGSKRDLHNRIERAWTVLTRALPKPAPGAHFAETLEEAEDFAKPLAGKTYVFSCGPNDTYRWHVAFEWYGQEPVAVQGKAPDADRALDEALVVAYERTGNAIPPDRVELRLVPEFAREEKHG